MAETQWRCACEAAKSEVGEPVGAAFSNVPWSISPLVRKLPRFVSACGVDSRVASTLTIYAPIFIQLFCTRPYSLGVDLDFA